MAKSRKLPYADTGLVRDTCLCFRLQKAARIVARRFDEAFRALELTNTQFTLLMMLNRPEPPTISDVSERLAADRTTLTANLKPLERRGLIEVAVDKDDKRSRRLSLTDRGHALLQAALPIWKREHAALDRLLTAKPVEGNPDRLRAELRAFY